MCRKKGKVTRIVEKIMGTPPNQHQAQVNTPRIREVDMQRVITMLGAGGMPTPAGNDQMPLQ